MNSEPMTEAELAELARLHGEAMAAGPWSLYSTRHYAFSVAMLEEFPRLLAEIARLRAERVWARALLAANDYLHLHMCECDVCQKKVVENMYADDGACAIFSVLLEAESKFRPALLG